LKKGSNVWLLLLPVLLPGGDAARPESEAIVRVLASRRKDADLPGMIAGIIRGDQLVGVGAVGVRKIGDGTPMTSDDVIHLGSNTKSMTATMIATLIEEGKLNWDTTAGQVFPREAESWDADWRAVTLHQLLTHTASLPANAEFRLLPGKTTTEQRRALLAREWLKKPPDAKPGTKHRYSNIGYMLAALMAETVTGKSWEELMRERLFGPLGMTRTGFGPPGTRGKVDQPWGHSTKNDKLVPSQDDNAACLGPAGTVHAPLGDWAKYVIQHLQSERDDAKTKLLLKPETFRKLHTPALEQYACGWLRIPPSRKTPYLFHNGSNTSWYAEMWLDPESDIAVLVATNVGGDKATRAVQAAAADLIKEARNK
jgi:CubicO group peptidase (beta-lactamase class C family)